MVEALSDSLESRYDPTESIRNRPVHNNRTVVVDWKRDDDRVKMMMSSAAAAVQIWIAVCRRRWKQRVAAHTTVLCSIQLKTGAGAWQGATLHAS